MRRCIAFARSNLRGEIAWLDLDVSASQARFVIAKFIGRKTISKILW